MQKTIALTLGAAVMSLTATSALAFPDKPIELVVPFSPGGGSDVAARVFSQCLENHLDQQVLIRNITGARGKIAEVEVRDARPDGYKLLWAHQGMDMGLATGRSDYNYKAFEPVASTVAMNYGIFADANSGIDSVASLREKVAADPGKYNIGVALDGFSHFAVLDFLDKAGISTDDLQTIPMSGDKTRIVAAIQGNLTLVPTAVAAAAPYVDSGDLNSAAILSDERDPKLADAPTADEQNVDSEFAMYFTTYAPANTPQDVIDTLADAWMGAAKDDSCQQRLANNSMTVVAASGEELESDLASRYARIEELAKKYHLGSE